MTGCSGGTPGLSTTRSASANVSSRCPPSSSSTPSRRSGSASGTLGARLGQRDARAAARQQLGGGEAASRRSDDGHAFVPATSNTHSLTHRSFNVVRLNSAKMIADDHEAGDHLRLAPADQLEVMVQRRHPEHPLAASS